MINKIDLLSEEEFRKLVSESSCTADILRTLDYSVKGNSWAYRIIQERMENLKITFGKKYIYEKGLLTKTPLEFVLTKDSLYSRTKLKKRLVEEGFKEYKCECCGISKWMNKSIELHIHHLNGISNDNRLSNLQLLCPNCHSITDNFRTKGKGRIIKRKADTFPIEEVKKIMKIVEEVGIVKARKLLPYRNSIINAIVKRHHETIIMAYPDKKETKEFSTSFEASKFLYEHFNIGINPESSRTGVIKCYRGKQKSIKGFTFTKRSVSV